MQRLLIALAMLTLTFTAQAQNEFSGGFKAGLNFSTHDGPLETDDETFTYNTGFHIGATFIYSITDLFGLKGEFMYSQKGVKYEYNGPSYFTFFSSNGNRIYATGNRRVDMSVSNSYIDIPLLAYFKIGRIEIEAGVNGAFLIGSAGSGGITFSGQSAIGDPVAQFTTGVDFGYFRDEPGTESLFSARNITINGITVLQPESIGAYYEAADNDGNKYQRFDVGLNAGISFFLNEGLFVGARANYGLLDVTNEEQDIAQAMLGPGNTYVTRDDVDKNISIQASVGFRF